MWLHVEVSSRCNAWCPSCSRNKNGFGLTGFVVEDLDPAILQQTIEKFNITQVQMCGNLGDPCAAKNIDKQLEVVRDVDRLQIHTNGSLRKPSWWADLARNYSHIEQFDVWFAIDGIGDTHSYYRQGTDYNRIIKNAQAFIDAGGSAYWQFIPFAHNEHQIKDCIRLSQQMGFKEFKFLRNARYHSNAFHYKTGEKLNIKPWSQDKKFNRIHRIKEHIEEKNCMHLEIPSIFLSSSGIVSPCCYMRGTDIKEVDIKDEFSNNIYRPVCIRSCG
jgi:MoaA/NifB/PqqE/SkfB family radical SAM enzyme